jgi:nucleotide-binding universal stress UspA family protein
MKISKILAAVDESDFTSKVLEVAMQITKAMNAELGLVSVVDPTPLVMSADNVVYPPEMMNDLVSATEEMLKKTRASLGTDVRITTFAPQGNPREMILETAKEFDADMIIVGTHGRTGLMHVVMGSVAENVIRHSGIPVLVVPSKSENH